MEKKNDQDTLTGKCVKSRIGLKTEISFSSGRVIDEKRNFISLFLSPDDIFSFFLFFFPFFLSLFQGHREKGGPTGYESQRPGKEKKKKKEGKKKRISREIEQD
jgi:hypothetical protein